MSKWRRPCLAVEEIDLPKAQLQQLQGADLAVTVIVSL